MPALHSQVHQFQIFGGSPMYQGTVYNTLTNQPIVGVTVTDGRNITKTDVKGHFSLSGWDRAHLISVGLLTQVHDDWYQPIEEDRTEYNFQVTPAPEHTPHTIIHLSDTEISASAKGLDHWIPFVKEKAAEQQADLILHTGDICRKPGLTQHREVFNHKTLGIPVRHTLGNHDFVKEPYGEYTFESLYGPVWYSFDYAGIHYIVASIDHGEAPSGYEREDQWTWLENDLKMKDPSQPLIITCHGGAKEPGEFHINTPERMALLKENNFKALIHGHFHVHTFNIEEGVSYVCTANPAFGGIDSSPAGLRVIRVNEKGSLTSKILYNDESKFTVPAADAEWVTKIPGRIQYATPLVTGDSLLVATVDDGFPKECGVTLLSPTGEIKWFYQTENSIKNDFALFNGIVYAQDHQGIVYALEASTGHLLWQKRVSIAGHVGSALNAAIYKGKLFAGYCQQITALDPATSETLWVTEKQGWCNGASSRLNFYENLVIVTANWGFIAAFDIETGERVWHMKPEKQLFGYATPLLDGEKLIAPNGSRIFVLEATTGKVLGIYDHPELCFNVCAQPVHDGSVYYLGTSENGVVALDADTFELKQTFGCGPAMIYSVAYSQGEISTVDGSVLIEGDKLIFSASDGYLYIYNKCTGKLLDRCCMGAPSFVKPIRMGDQLITADFNGNVISFKNI